MQSRLLDSWNRILFFLLFLGVFFIVLAEEDTSSKLTGKIRGFQIPEYYPIKQGQKSALRSLLIGKEAQPMQGGKIFVSGLRIECYGETGETNTVITTEDCFYLISEKKVVSDKEISLWQTDETFSIQGKGFLWDQKESLLVLSNQVKTRISNLDMSDFLSGSATSGKVQVSADEFIFDQKKSNAQYSGNVSVFGEQMFLNCDKLWLISADSKNGFKQISGEGKVNMRSDKPDHIFSAQGEHFIYVREQNELAISGDVRWESEGQRGRADFATLRQNGNELSATGNVRMEIQKNEIDLKELVGIPMAKDNMNRTDFLVSESDNFNSLDNTITLFGNVLIRDGDAALNCDTLNIIFRRSQEEETDRRGNSKDASRSVKNSVDKIEKIEALGNVKISQYDHRIETKRALYQTEESVVIFEEKVRWFSDELSGESDQLCMWSKPQHAEAIGNVIVIIPVEGHIQPLELFGPEVDSSLKGKEINTNRVTSLSAQELQIVSEKMYVDETMVVFEKKTAAEILPAITEKTTMQTDKLQLNFKDETLEDETKTKKRFLDSILADGNLLIEQVIFKPDTKKQRMKANRMLITMDQEAGTIKDVLAEKNVLMEQENVKAKGERAFFETKTQLLELTGNPVAQMPKGTLYAEKMVWDRKEQVFRGVSKFRIEGEVVEDEFR